MTPAQVLTFAGLAFVFAFVLWFITFLGQRLPLKETAQLALVLAVFTSVLAGVSLLIVWGFSSVVLVVSGM